MIRRLARAIQGIVTSYIFPDSDSTPVTVAWVLAKLKLSDRERPQDKTIANLEKQRDELTTENEALKISLNEFGSKLEISETSVQQILSEHEHLNDLLSQARHISAQHQLESEILQRTIATLKEQNYVMLRNYDATIEGLEELKVKYDELDKRYSNQKEMQKLRESLRDRKLDAGECFNGNEEASVESERGRPGFPNKIRGRFNLKILARSLSRPGTPEADEQRKEKQFEEQSFMKEAPKDLLPTSPGSINSLSSTSTSNNDSSEVFVVRDDDAKKSPERLRLLIPLSPTPLNATQRGSRSPLSPLFSGRSPQPYGATDSYSIIQRTQSPIQRMQSPIQRTQSPIQRAQSPLSANAPWRATSPIHQGMRTSSTSQPGKINSWYFPEGVDSGGRQLKGNKT